MVWLYFELVAPWYLHFSWKSVVAGFKLEAMVAGSGCIIVNLNSKALSGDINARYLKRG